MFLRSLLAQTVRTLGLNKHFISLENRMSLAPSHCPGQLKPRASLTRLLRLRVRPTAKAGALSNLEPIASSPLPSRTTFDLKGK
jgi:hypothetical protein